MTSASFAWSRSYCRCCCGVRDTSARLFTLEGIGEQIVHLPLSRLNVIDIVVLGQFVPILMDQRFVTGALCVCGESSVSVPLNMIEPNNGQALSTTQDARPRYTGERLLRERPKIYRQVVLLNINNVEVVSVTR